MKTDRLQEAANLVFMALCVWREARGENAQCKEAVAFSILNRVNRPSWWGKNIMEVVFKKWQYSSMTDPKDRQLTTWPKAEDIPWRECLIITDGVISGLLPNPAPGADSYYDISIPPPYWATPATFVAQIGRIRFYNLDRDIEVSQVIENRKEVN
jgi:spore germination cell wall hydrolase CwlJ-like protein